MSESNGTGARRIAPIDDPATLPWRKATASGAGNCVELAPMAGGEVAVRHSLHPDGGVLVYTRAEMAAFFQGVRDGEFDDLGR